MGQHASRPERDPEQGDHRRRSEDGWGDEALATGREGDDERREVDRQRPDPQERGRDQVRRDERRDRRQQAGRDRREQDPAQSPRGVDRAGVGGGDRVREPWRRGHAARRLIVGVARTAARRQERREHDEPDEPQAALGRQAEARLDQQRVRQQGQQGAAVAERVQPVRIAASRRPRRRPADAGEPARQERRRGRQQERRQPDHGAQEHDDAEGGREALDGDRCDPDRGQEQRDDPQHREADVDGRPPAAEPGHRHVRVQVARRRTAWKKNSVVAQTAGRAAEDRQGEPADQRLDREQQERGQPDRRGEGERAGVHAEALGLRWSMTPERIEDHLREPVSAITACPAALWWMMST